jgi:hypothetical protein
MKFYYKRSAISFKIHRYFYYLLAFAEKALYIERILAT